MRTLNYLLSLLPLHPRKLRVAALFFTAVALCLLASGCSSDEAGSACSSLRGFSSAARAGEFGGDSQGAIQPQRHAREHSLAATPVSDTLHRGFGHSF